MTDRMREVISDLSYVIGEETLAHMTAPYAKPFAPGGVPPRHEPEDLEGKSILPGPEDEKSGDAELYGAEKKVKELDKPIKTEQDQIRVPPPPSVDDPKGTSVVGKTPKPEKEGDPEFYKPEKPVKELDDPVKDKAQGKGASLEKKVGDIPAEKLKEQEEPPKPPGKREWKVSVGSAELDALIEKALGALKGKVEAARFRVNVRFEADEAGKAAAVEALKGVGLDVRGVEMESFLKEPGNRQKLAEFLDGLAQSCRAGKRPFNSLGETKLSRLLAGLTEQEGTLTKELVDAIFQIDQAIGHLTIVHDRLRKDPEADRNVRDEILGHIADLEAVAERLEKIRGKVA